MKGLLSIAKAVLSSIISSQIIDEELGLKKKDYKRKHLPMKTLLLSPRYHSHLILF